MHLLPYELYGLYRASVPVQGCTLPFILYIGQFFTIGMQLEHAALFLRTHHYNIFPEYFL